MKLQPEKLVLFIFVVLCNTFTLAGNEKDQSLMPYQTESAFRKFIVPAVAIGSFVAGMVVTKFFRKDNSSELKLNLKNINATLDKKNEELDNKNKEIKELTHKSKLKDERLGREKTKKKVFSWFLLGQMASSKTPLEDSEHITYILNDIKADKVLEITNSTLSVREKYNETPAITGNTEPEKYNLPNFFAPASAIIGYIKASEGHEKELKKTNIEGTKKTNTENLLNFTNNRISQTLKVFYNQIIIKNDQNTTSGTKDLVKGNEPSGTIINNNTRIPKNCEPLYPQVPTTQEYHIAKKDLSYPSEYEYTICTFNRICEGIQKGQLALKFKNDCPEAVFATNALFGFLNLPYQCVQDVKNSCIDFQKSNVSKITNPNNPSNGEASNLCYENIKDSILKDEVKPMYGRKLIALWFDQLRSGNIELQAKEENKKLFKDGLGDLLNNNGLGAYFTVDAGKSIVQNVSDAVHNLTEKTPPSEDPIVENGENRGLLQNVKAFFSKVTETINNNTKDSWYTFTIERREYRNSNLDGLIEGAKELDAFKFFSVGLKKTVNDQEAEKTHGLIIPFKPLGIINDLPKKSENGGNLKITLNVDIVEPNYTGQKLTAEEDKTGEMKDPQKLPQKNNIDQKLTTEREKIEETKKQLTTVFDGIVNGNITLYSTEKEVKYIRMLIEFFELPFNAEQIDAGRVTKSYIKIVKINCNDEKIKKKRLWIRSHTSDEKNEVMYSTAKALIQEWCCRLANGFEYFYCDSAKSYNSLAAVINNLIINTYNLNDKALFQGNQSVWGWGWSTEMGNCNSFKVDNNPLQNNLFKSILGHYGDCRSENKETDSTTN